MTVQKDRAYRERIEAEDRKARQALQAYAEATKHKWPPMHPRADERIENERCPNCGAPAKCIRREFPFAGGDLVPLGVNRVIAALQAIEEWACPTCDADLFALYDEPDVS